jgi:hypothetical protein
MGKHNSSNFLRELKDPYNYLPALGVIFSLLAAIVSLYKSGFSSEPVILFILAFLSFDALMERIGYQRTIQEKVVGLETEVNSLRRSIESNKARFLNRDALNAREPFKDFLTKGERILITGLTLVGTIGPLLQFFKKRVNEGAQLQFLLLDKADEHLLEFAAKVHGVSSDALRSDIGSSIEQFKQLSRAIDKDAKGSVELKVLKTLPTASVTLVGPRDKPNSLFVSGEIRCELYLYKIGVDERPAFNLTPSDGEIFIQCKAAVLELWDASEPYEEGINKEPQLKRSPSPRPIAESPAEKQPLKTQTKDVKRPESKTDYASGS